MDNYNDDFKVTAKVKSKSYETDYESLSQGAVERLMQKDVDHICGIFGVDVSWCPLLLFILPHLSMQAGSASLLLRYGKWNKERLIEKYMDNPTKIMVAAGVSLPEPGSPLAGAPIRTQSSSTATSSTSARRPLRSTSKLLGFASGSKPSNKSSPTSPNASFSLPKALKASKSDAPFVCPICFDEGADLKTLSLDCAHVFCINCWTSYVTSKVKDEGEHAIRCMAEGCALIVPDSFIHELLVSEPGASAGDIVQEAENAAAWSRFQELLVRHFVGCNPNLKFCPYPSCTNTVSCPGAAHKSSLTTLVPTVSCGARGVGGSSQSASQSLMSPGGLALLGKEHKFCFGCPIESDHRPVICGVAKMWLQKCRDDSETANWIKSNTKECSQCQSTIEKNGGCK